MEIQRGLPLDDRIENIRRCKRISVILAGKGIKTFRGLSRRKEENIIRSCFPEGLTPGQLKILTMEMEKRGARFLDWQTSLLRVTEGVPGEFILWCWGKGLYSWNDVFASLTQDNQMLLEELLSYKDKRKRGPIADFHFYMDMGLPMGGVVLLLQHKVSPKDIREGVSFSGGVISPLRKHGAYADHGRTLMYSVWFVKKKMAERRKCHR